MSPRDLHAHYYNGALEMKRKEQNSRAARPRKQRIRCRCSTSLRRMRINAKMSRIVENQATQVVGATCSPAIARAGCAAPSCARWCAAFFSISPHAHAECKRAHLDSAKQAGSARQIDAAIQGGRPRALGLPLVLPANPHPTTTVWKAPPKLLVGRLGCLSPCVKA